MPWDIFRIIDSAWLKKLRSSGSQQLNKLRKMYIFIHFVPIFFNLLVALCPFSSGTFEAWFRWYVPSLVPMPQSVGKIQRFFMAKLKINMVDSETLGMIKLVILSFRANKFSCHQTNSGLKCHLHVLFNCDYFDLLIS